jgi:hypothetical protein
MYSNKYYDLCLVLLTMNEWAACIDAITFIFQARTTPINNEKKKRVKTKREKARHIHIHTYCSHNSASKFIDVYVWLMNRTCEDYSNYRKQIYIYLVIDLLHYTRPFVVIGSYIRWDSILPNWCTCEFVRVLFVVMKIQNAKEWSDWISSVNN